MSGTPTPAKNPRGWLKLIPIAADGRWVAECRACKRAKRVTDSRVDALAWWRVHREDPHHQKRISVEYIAARRAGGITAEERLLAKIFGAPLNPPAQYASGVQIHGGADPS